MRTPEEAASHIEALELRLVGAEDVILHQHKRLEALEADQNEEDTAFKGLLEAHRNAVKYIEALEAALRYISEAYGVPNDLKQIAIRALEGKHE